MNSARTGMAVLALVAMGLVGGCATTRSAGEGGRQDVLTRDQILGVQGARNLYEVVQRLRPRWLTVRASDRSFAMATEIAVYQDMAYLGDIETLRQLGTSLPYEMRWMDGTTAGATLPGLGAGRHVAGAIIISTKAKGS